MKIDLEVVFIQTMSLKIDVNVVPIFLLVMTHFKHSVGVPRSADFYINLYKKINLTLHL